MRHRVSVLASTAALLALSVAPVQAAVFEVVIGQPPPGWVETNFDCGNKASGAVSGGSLAPKFGPAVNGTSDGSIAITAGDSDMEGFALAIPRFADLAEIGGHFWEAPGGRFAYRITVDTGSGIKALVWEPNPTDETWAPANPFLNSTPWTVYDDNSIANPAAEPTTLAAFQLLYPEADFTFGLVSWGCLTASTVYVDTMRVVVNGVEYAYDFEPQPTSVAIDSNKTTVVSGNPVQLSTVLLDHLPEPLAGSVRLVAAPSHGVAYPVGTADTDSTGIGALTDTPVYTTVYRWYFDGAGIHGPSQSVKLKIPVKSKVTASLADATVMKGERVKVTGELEPGWNDLLMTLWRETSTGKVKLGTARTTPNSTFKLLSSAISTTGSATWKVYVTSAPTEDNTAGKSKVLKVSLN